MKHLKMLGFAAIAATGLMAFVGAGSASATTLFTNSNLTNPYPAGTTVEMTLTKGRSSTFTGSSGEVLMTCSGSALQSSTSNESGTTVSGSISSLTWSGCTTTQDTVANGSLSIERTGTNEAKVTGAGSQWTYNVFGVSCTYGTGNGTTLGTITGGAEPILHVNAVGLTKTAGGFLCPTIVGWDAEYTFTEPHAFYVGA